MSLDGYVRSPNVESDSIRHDPATDFAAVYAGFHTVLLGRPTYELTNDWAPRPTQSAGA